MARPKKISLSKEEIIAFLKKNKAYIKKEFGVTKMALFGSYARDEQKASSDIDLLIEEKTYDFRKLVNLRRFLERAFNRKVDIGDFDAVRLVIKRNIQKDLIYVWQNG